MVAIGGRSLSFFGSWVDAADASSSRAGTNRYRMWVSGAGGTAVSTQGEQPFQHKGHEAEITKDTKDSHKSTQPRAFLASIFSTVLCGLRVLLRALCVEALRIYFLAGGTGTT